LADKERQRGRRRIREWGIMPGSLPAGDDNSILDVDGVEVGQVTLIKGRGNIQPGRGPVRTGVTAIWPHRDNIYRNPVPAGVEVINGYGKALGLAQIEELGELASPIVLTGTLNVGRVADGLIDYMLKENPDIGIDSPSFNPVVLECNDGYLNDLQGRHVKREHVHRALIIADDEMVCEGDVGAGTGMTSFGFKGGVGTASRVVRSGGEEMRLGAFVLNNFGRRENLLIDGLSLHRLDPDLLQGAARPQKDEDGSVIIIMAVDIPLTNRDLTRISRRAVHGLARVGSISAHGSGDFALAFSPATGENENYREPGGKTLSKLFQAAAEATEEAVLNSLFMAATMRGRDGHTSPGLPGRKVVAAYNELLSEDSLEGS